MEANHDFSRIKRRKKNDESSKSRITKGDIRRLGYRAGVTSSCKADILEEEIDSIEKDLKEILSRAVIISKQDNKKTIDAECIKLATEEYCGLEVFG